LAKNKDRVYILGKPRQTQTVKKQVTKINKAKRPNRNDVIAEDNLESKCSHK